MKTFTVALVGLVLFFSVGVMAPIVSSPLNLPVWALYGSNVKTPVDVDMDGNTDVFIYANLDWLIQDQGVASPEHLMITTAESVYVSCLNVPLGPWIDGAFNSITYFTTFAEDESIGPEFDSPFFSWETGDLPFIGYEIAGGIPSRDSYLGVKIVKESGAYYGWVRLIFPASYDYIDETSYLKVKETSYQTTQDASIVAGFGQSVMPSNFKNSIRTVNAESVEVEIEGIAGLTCQLLESSDLLSWDTVVVKYSTLSDFSQRIVKGDASKFYKWKITENFEL